MARLPVTLVLLIAATAAGCGGSQTTTVTESATVTEAAPADGAPTAALEELLSSQTTGDADYRDPVSSGGLVTEGFVEAVEEGSRDLGYLDFNPFLCSQQLPRKITYADEAIEGDQARVTALVRYGGGTEQTQVYDMAFEDASWKLDRSECMN